MARPSSAQIERARRLLAHEAATGSAAEAAGHVYDKLVSHLAPLVGPAGVRALFVRSAKLARAEVDGLADPAALDSSAKLRETLESQDPAAATEAAAALFGAFLGLLTTFIGERLTIQALRNAWPTIEAAAPTEKKNE